MHAPQFYLAALQTLFDLIIAGISQTSQTVYTSYIFGYFWSQYCWNEYFFYLFSWRDYSGSLNRFE